MPISTTTLTTFIEVFEAVQTALPHWDVPEKSGVACTKGTMTARGNTLKLIRDQLETRDPKAADEQTLTLTMTTLKWLATDKDVTRDFVDVDLPVADTSLSKDRPDLVQSGSMAFEPAMAMLIATMENLILS